VNVVAIVQARCGSTRLPNKVLADIAGTPMIMRVIERTLAARQVDKLVVATTTNGEDDTLVDFLAARGVCDVYRGSVLDVLDRYHACAILHRAEVIVRVTADDPLKDPQIIDRAIGLLLADAALDYCSNTLLPTYPEGLDIEVFRMRALQRAHDEARLASEREHVTPYIWKHDRLFKLLNFSHDRDLSQWRWTVDKPEDLAFVEWVYRHFRNQPLVPFRDVIRLVEQIPEHPGGGSETLRNEGYLKSIAEDESNKP